jgi:glycerophosphoryl diester phosphodiesterase
MSFRNKPIRVIDLLGLFFLFLTIGCSPTEQKTGLRNDHSEQCVFQPCTETNLYKQEVIYRLLYAQNALLYGSDSRYSSYNPARIRRVIDSLFQGSSLEKPGGWQEFRQEFAELWFGLPEVKEGMDEAKWMDSNLDLVLTAYAFELTPSKLRSKLFAVTSQIFDQKETVLEFWETYRTALPEYLENPRINELHSLTGESSPPEWKQKLTGGKSLIIAHRGGYSGYPENSLEAFREAYLHGVDGIECDLRLSADGEVVVLHDDNLYSATHQDVRTSELTLESILKLRLRDPFQLDELSPYTPTTLEMVLREFGGKFLLWLELKQVESDDLPTKVAQLIKKYQLEDSIIVSSLVPRMVNPLRQEFRDLRIAFEFNKLSEPQIGLIDKLIQAEDSKRLIISCEEFQAATPPVFKRIQDRSILISTFTPNRYDDLANSAKNRIRFIQTDRPDRVKLLSKNISQEN